MHYVYLLWSASLSQYYVGSTDDLRQRLRSHNAARNIATKAGVPWRLVYYESYLVKADALERERKLKHHGKGLAELKRRITLTED